MGQQKNPKLIMAGFQVSPGVLSLNRDRMGWLQGERGDILEVGQAEWQKGPQVQGLPTGQEP